MKKMLRVLAVDDSEDDVELICNELAEGGFTVVSQRVETAESLSRALECEPWDVVICDHNLPALDSASALRIVWAVTEDVPFIVVSGDIPDEMAIEAMRSGARDFIHKGNLSRLVPVVERELQQVVMQTKLKAAQQMLHKVSDFDSLTGLPNRQHLFKRLKTKMFDTHSGTGPGHPFAVFMIDLNRFRQVTKALGMFAGNKVLIETAERLCAVFGENDFVARLGADIFAVVVPNFKHEAGAEDIAVAIHRCIGEAYQIDGHKLFIKASVGASFYPGNGQNLDDLFKNAESALYSAKTAGGGNYTAYKPEMDAKEKALLTMEANLYRALEEGQFVLHYQPQYDLARDRLIGAEALIRWQHPELGLISPGEFVPLLEETGLIISVGEWVLRTACAQNKKWQEAGAPPVVIAVNLSVMQFRAVGLARMVRRVLDETGLSPEYLELEITENIAMHDGEGVVGTLGELRSIGVKISIDDFGTGYSSLSYLKRFPIDKLKIDQSFIRDMKADTEDGSIVTAIIGMGRSLKLRVIAEGVETQEQADILKRYGCDEAQGYFYARPMETSNFALFMAQ